MHFRPSHCCWRVLPPKLLKPLVSESARSPLQKPKAAEPDSAHLLGTWSTGRNFFDFPTYTDLTTLADEGIDAYRSHPLQGV